MIHRLFIRRFGKSLGIKNKKTERYRTDRAKPTIERQKRGRKSGNRKPSRNRKNGAITDTPTPTPLPSLPDFSDTSYEMFPNRQKKTPQLEEFPGIKNRGIKKCKAKDNQIIIHFSSVPLF